MELNLRIPNHTIHRTLSERNVLRIESEEVERCMKLLVHALLSALQFPLLRLREQINGTCEYAIVLSPFEKFLFH